MTKVTIYSLPTCPYCKMAKRFLDENKIEYQDIDVLANPDEAEIMIKKSGQMGTPVIIVEKDGQEEMIVGFDQQKLSQVLGIS
ncbi:MAG: glutaredoxin family protein [Patescibacteria group bacterium]|jgi:glutaredoxin-like YruB-family protein